MKTKQMMLSIGLSLLLVGGVVTIEVLTNSDGPNNANADTAHTLLVPENIVSTTQSPDTTIDSPIETAVAEIAEDAESSDFEQLNIDTSDAEFLVIDQAPLTADSAIQSSSNASESINDEPIVIIASAPSVAPSNVSSDSGDTGGGSAGGSADTADSTTDGSGGSSQVGGYSGETLSSDTEVNLDKSWFESRRPRLGLEALDKDSFLIPWVPVDYSTAEETATVLNRTYSFAGEDLLFSVKAAEVNLLDSPVLLNIKVDGSNGSLVFGDPQVAEARTGDGRLVLTRTGSFSYVQAVLTYTIEYDGLVWCELSLTVPQGSPYLQRVQLVVVLDEDVAAFTHYVGAPAKYTSQNLPENSYSKELPNTAGNHFKSGLKTMVWVGNNDHGLLWCIESDQYWWSKDRQDCISLDRQQDGTLQMSIDMVSSILPSNAPRTVNYSFGLMATPVKPRPQGWRGWTFSTQRWDSTIVGSTRASNLIYWPDEYRYMALDQDPTRYRNVYNVRKTIARDHSQGRQIIPYWTRLNIQTRDQQKRHPDAELMIKEWGLTPNNPSKDPDFMYYRLSAKSGWADYLVWCVEGFAEKMGHLDGVYLDEVQPVPNTRAGSLGGYYGLNGTRRPTFEFFGTRNLIKRLVYNTYQRNKNRPRIVAHCSATHTMNCLSGADVLLIGEQYNIAYLKNHPELKPPTRKQEEQQYYYSYALPMDRMRTECFGRQWGEVVVWLPQLKGQSQGILESPVTTRDMLSRVMQGDVLVWPLWCNTKEVYKTWKFREEFDIGSSDVEFIPYWENTSIVAKPVGSYSRFQKNSEIVVGYYHNTARETYLVLVSNLSRYPAEVEIDFGDLRPRTVKNAETNIRISPNNRGDFVMGIKRNDYKVLRVNY